jgi:hypothetical protein
MFAATPGQGAASSMRWLLRRFDSLAGDVLALGQRLGWRWSGGQ